MSDLPDELIGLSLSEASDLLAAGKVSSVELTRAILEQIERTDPVVFAYATVMPEEAMRAAAQADTELARRGGWRGPLHGIPIGVKDIIYARGAPTEAGSEALKGFDPDRDATVVTRLRKAAPSSSARRTPSSSRTARACLRPATPGTPTTRRAGRAAVRVLQWRLGRHLAPSAPMEAGRYATPRVSRASSA